MNTVQAAQESTRTAHANVVLAGTGSALPETRIASHLLERKHGLATGTIELALGVAERRVAAAEIAASDLAVLACARALEAARTDAADVGLLLLATSTTDHITPATAPLVAHRLGMRCGASDVANTCSGWLTTLDLAARWLAAEPPGATAVVAASNILSRRVDWTDWKTAALFGDGAGAVVLRREAGAVGAPPRSGNSANGKAPPGWGILSSSLQSDGSGYDRIQVPAGGSRRPLTPERMQAREHLLRIHGARLEDSLRLLVETAQDALAKAGLQARDIDHFLPHQANAKLIQAAAQALGIPAQRTHRNLRLIGNTSAASIPILLDEAARSGHLRRGDTLLMSVVAGGMSAASAVARWGHEADA
jgi:3-oxoacyl-[acyl-carrier-protein] synthase III